VNGWMNHPRLGEAPLKALFGNSYFWHEMVHMYLAAFLVAGFVTASVYAVARLRGRRDRYVRVAMAVPLVVAAVTAPAQVVVGDWAARSVAENQPVKLAAFEGLGRTEKGAPLHIGGWYDDERREVRYGIAIPKLLSLLAFHDPNATVKGLESVPPEDRPPVNVVRVAFFTMVGIGTLMALFGVALLVVWWRRRALPEGRWFLRLVAAFGPLSAVALIAGWVTTEVGRQPWVVYGHMRTEEAVTGAGGIPVGYAALVAIYLSLAAATLWLLRRLARAPLEVEAGDGPG
jgi:cytochrome bd ubiquinol oxidase subunit I